MMIVSQFRQLNLSVVNVRTYLFAVLFVGGNMLLPQLCHLMPDGGKIFLPIYFFTLIVSYKFGFKVGILIRDAAGRDVTCFVGKIYVTGFGGSYCSRQKSTGFFIACRCGGGGLSGARWYSRMVDRFGFVCCIARF